jgi:aminopeptidase N
MLAVWREWGLDKILLKAYKQGIIMSGVSAGAICWFEKGITDSWKDHQAILPCLGFVNGVCCPHYDEEPERIPFVKEILEDKRISECMAIEGFCALHLIDDIPKYSVSFGNSKNCFLVNKKDSIINHNQIEKTELIQL